MIKIINVHDQINVHGGNFYKVIKVHGDTPCPKSQEVGRKIAGTYTVHFWHLGGIQNLG